MRRAARTDDNQSEIVEALRAVGASVQPLHRLGGGVPDLLVGFCEMNFVLEVKDGSKPPSARRLTPDEQRWMRGWRGQKAVVKNASEALAVIGVPPA